MELLLKRQIFTNKSTIGRLYVNGQFQCYILEDVTRPPNVKIKNETAIPYGKYEVTMDFSNRFQKLMPHILNVPMFSGVRIHAGNDKDDTEGCLLCGTSVAPDWVSGSRDAFKLLYEILLNTYTKEKITLEIIKDGA